MTNDKKQPRYVAEHAGLGDWTVTDKQLLITVAYQCRQSMASHIADCLNACDGAEGLTPGCVAKMGAFKDELCYLVDRLGHDSGGFCSWGQESPTAKEWANEVYRIALDNEAYIIAAKDAEIARLRDARADMAMLIRRIAKGRSTDAQCAAMDYLARTGQAGTLLRNNTESEATDKACDMCDGTGGVDSGGQTPWGGWITVPCPACNTESEATDDQQ